METLFIGQNAIYLPSVESTNSYAIELLKNVNLIEGSVVYTYNQTHGKGQRGNTWICEPGLNLALSIVLKPQFLNIKKVHFLYIISALAVHDLMTQILGSSQYDIKIKWPNDILVNSKKIAGILNENIIQNSGISYSVVGIGLNVNQTRFGELGTATSLKTLIHSSTDTRSVLEDLCRHFEHYYLKLKNEHYTELLEDYYRHLFKLDSTQRFSIGDQELELTVKGINDSGKLHLRDAQNKDHYFDVKEIKWLS